MDKKYSVQKQVLPTKEAGVDVIRFFKKIAAGFFAFAVMAAVGPAAALAEDENKKFSEYTSPGNYFTCTIPADWSVYAPGFGLSAEEKKVYGLTLLGPRNGSKVSPEISLHYYAPGNLLHKTMERFIRLHAGPVLGEAKEGTSYGTVGKIIIADREAKAFERKNVQFIGGRSLNPEKVALHEEYIVVPDRKNEGFYVVRFSVPEELKDRDADTFKTVAKSFFPKK